MQTFYPIAPVPKPRMTRSDRWKARPAVMRYRAFCDEARLFKMRIVAGDSVEFRIPMPSSWPEWKKAEHDGIPHRSTPDLDNLIKAALDAIYNDDAGIHALCASKVWARDGAIVVTKGGALK